MLEDIIIPIFVCVILPVTIVGLVMWTRRNETNRKTEVMLKAIENGSTIDPEFFQTKQKPKSVKKELLDKLTGACVTFAMGIAFLVLAIVRYISPEVSLGFFGQGLPYVGGILLAIGIGLFISYFVGKKMMAKEIEAEERALEHPGE